MADVISRTINTQIRKLLSDGTYQVEHPETAGKQVIMTDGRTLEEVLKYQLDDTSGSPGRAILQVGTLGAGYFGFVSASELITGDDLALMVGISTGSSINSAEGWLKFAYKEKIQFVAKKPFRDGISWDDINSAGCVFGTKTVIIGNLEYRVRLMRGTLTDPNKDSDSDRGANGSEWNALMLPIHIKARDGSWKFSQYATNVPYWEIDYTDTDLLTKESSLCQETRGSNVEESVTRGGWDASDLWYGQKAIRGGGYYWRPVLELIQ